MNISHFYAMLSRMRYINRWGLMNNTRCENLSEHSLDVAVIAHCLVLIHNKRFGGNLNAERAALLALFHDATEIITGDMTTPVKYFNPEIKNDYQEIEEIKMGNSEFSKAKESTEKSIHNMNMPENEVFEKEFLPSFYLSLDEQD